MNNCKSPKNEKHNLKEYEMIRANGGVSNWPMFIIEDYPCKSYREATLRERLWCDVLHADMNTNCPGRSLKEWRQQKIVCECGRSVPINHISEHKKSRRHLNFVVQQNSDKSIHQTISQGLRLIRILDRHVQSAELQTVVKIQI